MPCNLMSPLLLQSVPWADRDAFADMLGTMSAWHRVLSVKTKTAFRLIDDLRRQMAPHAQMHTDVAKALGIPAAQDLLSYDLSDRDSFIGFTQLEALDLQRLRVAANL